jgi:protein tyrosine phosphatase (PTP) superfamily phosphohydrolase (DUF442 family)
MKQKSAMIEWVVHNSVARSAAPGYPDIRVEIQSLIDWIREVKQMGVKSILCLLEDKELKAYRFIPYGILAYYERCGLRVGHVPVGINHLVCHYIEEEQTIRNVFLDLPKPVLIHCSDGLLRTGAVIGMLFDNHYI